LQAFKRTRNYVVILLGSSKRKLIRWTISEY